MTYSDAIEQVMLNNGYFAPLKLLYGEIWKYKDKTSVEGKTPIATIQERVQRDRRFTKIGYGVYALTDKLPVLKKLSETAASEKRKNKFEREIGKNAFNPIRDRVEFMSYEKIESDYDASFKKLYI
jgi:hypothetical protein